MRCGRTRYGQSPEKPAKLAMATRISEPKPDLWGRMGPSPLARRASMRYK
jgi:hypothetical protein